MTELFVVILVLVVVARSVGELMQMLGQPAILGELLASLGTTLAGYHIIVPGRR